MKNNLCSYLAALLLLAGCNQADVMAKFTPAKEDAEARIYIQQLQDKDFEKIESHLDTAIKTPDTRAALEKMSALIPPGPPKSVKTVGAHTFKSGSVETVNLTYEFEYPSTWLLINVLTETKAGSTHVTGFHVTPEADSIENKNRFSLAGKSFLHYACLVLTIAALAFTLVTLVVCIRTRPLKRKWLWIIGILFGVCKFGVNWTSGEMFFQPVYFQMFSASAFAALYGPWMVSFSIPVFAFMFWGKRKKIMREAQSETAQLEAAQPVTE